MQFGDKLQKIRKENNITQEGLADKLDVSRQAVSKWESGQAYPDTEKLIQISKIFNVSLDELIGENKSSPKENGNTKLNVMEVLQKVYKFISDVFSMFMAMRFRDKIKFIIEMMIVIGILFLVSIVSTNIVCFIMDRIFMFLPSKVSDFLLMFISSILYILWLVIGGIIFVRDIKTRYLDYYIIIKDDNVKEKVLEEPIKELKERKEYKVVIRDPKNSNDGILSKIAKIFIFGLKILGVIILIPIVIGFVILMACFAISLMFIIYGLFFNGISMAILGGLIFTYIVIEFIARLLFNKKLPFVRMFIMFIISISLVGIGMGLSTYAFSNYIVIDNAELNEKTDSLYMDMKDNLVFVDINNLGDDKIVIDNSLDNIKMDITTYGDATANIYSHVTYYHEEDEPYNVVVSSIHVDYDEFGMFKNMVEGMKKKEIREYNNYADYRIDKIYISNDNLTKIRENNKKYYE